MGLYVSTPQAPEPLNPAQVSADTLKAQLQAETGTGQFAEFGPLSSLQAKYDPLYTAIGLQKTQQWLQGVNGQPGLVDILATSQPQIDALTLNSRSAGRAADIADWQALGPDARAAMRAANPEMAAQIGRAHV